MVRSIVAIVDFRQDSTNICIITHQIFDKGVVKVHVSVSSHGSFCTGIYVVTGAEFVILLGMRKLYDVKIKTLPFDYL